MPSTWLMCHLHGWSMEPDHTLSDSNRSHRSNRSKQTKKKRNVTFHSCPSHPSDASVMWWAARTRRSCDHRRRAPWRYRGSGAPRRGANGKAAANWRIIPRIMTGKWFMVVCLVCDFLFRVWWVSSWKGDGSSKKKYSIHGRHVWCVFCVCCFVSGWRVNLMHEVNLRNSLRVWDPDNASCSWRECDWIGESWNYRNDLKSVCHPT